jgi:putative transposase
MKSPRHPRYTRHRFPAEVISYAVWLYFRFPLSLRMVEELLAACGILVSHETVRQWALKFGQSFANQIRRRLPAPGDKWHLDEVVINIAGQKHWLWRAVDQHGVVLDILVQSRRNATAAERLLRKLLKKQGIALRVMITDKLASYGAAKREIMPGVEHRQHKGLINRAENSHQPTRRREGLITLRGLAEMGSATCPSLCHYTRSFAPGGERLGSEEPVRSGGSEMARNGERVVDRCMH